VVFTFRPTLSQFRAYVDIYVNCAEGLGNIKDKRGIPILLSALRQNYNMGSRVNSRIRRNAIYALGEIGGQQAKKAIIKTLKSSPYYLVRESAVYALEKWNDQQSINALIHALQNDRDSSVRAVAARMLGGRNNTAAIQALKTAADDKKSYHWEDAINALLYTLIKTKNKSVVAFLINKFYAIKDNNPLIDKKNFLKAFALSSDKRGLAVIIHALADKKLRTTAALAFLKFYNWNLYHQLMRNGAGASAFSHTVSAISADYLVNAEKTAVLKKEVSRNSDILSSLKTLAKGSQYAEAPAAARHILRLLGQSLK
jgi:hypothetical protein